jgi:alpha-ribazole phosphatase
MTLHLVRHGPTHASVMVGWTDIVADLSDHAAISRLSAHLPEHATLVSSDLIRARTTADALTSLTRTRLPDDPDLREIHFGAWEMRSFAEVQAETPDHIRAFWETPGSIAPPQGESWHTVVARVTKALERMPEGDTIVVCHFGAILAALQCCLGIPALQAFSHRIDNLSVTRLQRSSGIWHAPLINHCP